MFENSNRKIETTKIERNIKNIIGNMNDLQNLSIADLKATLDYIKKTKTDLLNDLKSQGKETKNNTFLDEYDRVEFIIHRELSKRIKSLFTTTSFI